MLEQKEIKLRKFLMELRKHCKHPVSLMIVAFLSPNTQASPTFWLPKVPLRRQPWSGDLVWGKETLELKIRKNELYS